MSSAPSLTSVSGLRVGHAHGDSPAGASGCTVILGPFRAAVEVRGFATGTRELETLAPGHLVRDTDALLLTGGSAFGLAAADGVAGWLAERGRGFDTGVAPVPLVPAAVIFDLAEGRPRPDAPMGREACGSADDGPVETGTVGAGAGATVGKLLGPGRCSIGGLGSDGGRAGSWTVGALAVVNALGNVLDASGRVVAGVRSADGAAFVPAAEAVAAASAASAATPPQGSGEGLAGTNTTLAVVATDAPLGRVELVRMARMATTALARRIDPVHTPFDGDVVFALSTGAVEDAGSLSAGELLRLGLVARDVLERALTGAVASGKPGGA